MKCHLYLTAIAACTAAVCIAAACIAAACIAAACIAAAAAAGRSSNRRKDLAVAPCYTPHGAVHQQ